MVKAVTYILENDATVQELVGADPSGEQHKVYPVVSFEDNKIPYLIVSVVARPRMGKGCNFNYQIQVSSYAASYDEVTELNEAVISALEGQGTDNINGISFGYMNFITEADGVFDKDRMAYVKNAIFEGAGEPLT